MVACPERAELVAVGTAGATAAPPRPALCTLFAPPVFSCHNFPAALPGASLSQAVPLEGVAESVHSAGQYLVAAVAELGPSYPDSLNGSIVVLDFAGEGFGAAPPERPARAAPRGKRPAEQQQQEGRGPQQRGSSKASRAGKRSAGVAAGSTQRKVNKGAKSGKARAAAKPSSGGRGSGRRQQAAPAADEEAGPSRKRGRR